MTVEQQLAFVSELPPEQFEIDMAEVWAGDQLPTVVQRLIDARSAGLHRLADTLAAYWSVALETRWRSMRAVLDDDVAYRAAELTKGGLSAMLADLHDQVSVHDEGIRINKAHSSEERMSEAALMLVPSVFVWPNVIFAPGPMGSATLTYPARGVGRLWAAAEATSEPDDALAALLGRSRAAILGCLVLPHSTSELSLKLGQSAPAVSQHLAVLRRSGLVVSWRSGRSVLYRCTALATSIIEANDISAPAQRDA